MRLAARAMQRHRHSDQHAGTPRTLCKDRAFVPRYALGASRFCLVLFVLLGGNTLNPALAASDSQRNPDLPFVGAYYFNWYNLNNQWQSFPRERNPKLGEYDQSSPEVMSQHHEWAKQGGIDFFAMLWEGAGSQDIEDDQAFEIDKRITAHLELPDAVPTALVYNFRDVVDAGTRGTVDLAESNYCQIVTDQLMYAAKNHFKKPNYFRYGGSPVLFLYTLRDYTNYEDCLKLAFTKMKRQYRETPYIIGDAVWWYPAPEKMDWDGWARINVSAVTAYNLYDAGQPSKMGHSFAWSNAQVFHDTVKPAWSKKMMVVPSVVPGFDDQKLRDEDRPVISRDGGAELVQQWKQLLWLMKCQPKFLKTSGGPFGKMFSRWRKSSKESSPIMMVNSFNEWHEGSEIEPDTKSGDTFLKLLKSLKTEIPSEDIPCFQEKDASKRSPKLIYPKQFMDTGEKSRTKGDTAWIQGVRFIGWFFIMWILFLNGAPLLLRLTGSAPHKKAKDDDLPGLPDDFQPLPSMSAKPQAPRRSFTLVTWAVIVVIGVLVYWVVWLIFLIPAISGFFDSRYEDYQAFKAARLKAARAAAHSLCPQMTLNLHQDKFDDWVQRLADNQISQAEFRENMCGEDPLHRREIQETFLKYTGREPEDSDLEKFIKDLEEGETTLREIEATILATDEAREWAQFVNAEHTKIPRAIFKTQKIFKDALKNIAEKVKESSREEKLGDMEVVAERVEQLEQEGRDEEAAQAIKEFDDAQAQGRMNRGNQKRVIERNKDKDSMLGKRQPKGRRRPGRKMR